MKMVSAQQNLLLYLESLHEFFASQILFDTFRMKLIKLYSTMPRTWNSETIVWIGLGRVLARTYGRNRQFDLYTFPIPRPLSTVSSSPSTLRCTPGMLLFIR